MLHQEDSDEWLELGNRARAAFQCHGMEETWRQFSVHARLIRESERGFIYLVFEAFADEPEQLASVLDRAVEVWPDDIETLGLRIRVDICRGHGDRASKQLESLRERFPDRLSDAWLADRYAELNRSHEALRYYGLASERDPTNSNLHFKAGWFGFVSGDFEGSIESTRHGLEFQPTKTEAEFNLGIALLAHGDTVGAEVAYRRGAALARRLPTADAREVLEHALGNFPLLPELSDGAKDTVDRIRTWLQAEHDRLEPVKSS